MTANTDQSPSGNIELDKILAAYWNAGYISKWEEGKGTSTPLDKLRTDILDLLDQTATNRCIKARIDELEELTFRHDLADEAVEAYIDDRIAELKARQCSCTTDGTNVDVTGCPIHSVAQLNTNKNSV